MIYSIKIESFVFNEEENEEEDEAAAKRANDFDEELVDSSIESQLKKDSYYCGAMKKEDFMDSDASIDSDTRVKLEALLSNAGIDSITSDLLKDPQIMHTLTTTYVRTLNEVMSKSGGGGGVGYPAAGEDPRANLLNSKNSEVILGDVVESTFEEFILAAAAVAAASASAGNPGVSNNANLNIQLDLGKNGNYNEEESDEMVENEDEEDEEEEEEEEEEDDDDDDDDEYDEDADDDQSDEEDEEEEDNEDYEQDDDEEEEDEEEYANQASASETKLNTFLKKFNELNEKNKELKKNAASSVDDQSAMSNCPTTVESNKQAVHDSDANGLLLFSTATHLVDESDAAKAASASLGNPESILSKLIEFRSNATQNDLI